MLRALVVAACLMLAGCVSPVVVDYQARAHFQQYDTYAFASADNDATLSLDAQRIRSAITSVLSAAGIKRVSPDQAALLVHYRIEEVTHVESAGFSFGVGFGFEHIGVGLGTGPSLNTVHAGRLIVKLEDASTHAIVWRAESRHPLEPDMTGEKRRERIHELIRQMFKHFPPGQADDG